MATYFFDSTSGIAGFGSVTGNWLGSSTWTTSETGTGTNVVWPSGNAASFGSAGASPTQITGGTLTLTSSVSLTGIAVANALSAVTISGAGGTLAFGANQAAFAISSKDLTVTSTITGTNGLSKTGAAILFLKGTTSGMTGQVIQNTGSGYLIFEPSTTTATVLTSSASVVVNGGARVYSRLITQNTCQYDYACDFSGAGEFWHAADSLPSPVSLVTNTTGSLTNLNVVTLYGFGIVNATTLPYGAVQFLALDGRSSIFSVTPTSGPVSNTAFIAITGNAVASAHTINSLSGTAANTVTLTGGIRRTDAEAVVRTFTLSGTNTGDNTIAGNATNASASATNLVKSDVGTWLLSGDNSALTGTFAISGGVLKAGSNNALGGGATAVTVASNTVLGLQNGITVSRPITISSGTLRNYQNNNTVSGTLSLTGTSIVEALSGRMNITPTAATGIANLTFKGAGDVVFSPNLTSNTGTCTKQEAGLTVLQPTTGAQSPGFSTTAVNGGTLMGVYGTWATGDKLLGANVTVGAGGRIQLSSSGTQAGRNAYTNLTFNGAVGNPARICIGGVTTNPTVLMNGNLTLPSPGQTTFDLSDNVFKTKGTYTLIEFGSGYGVTGLPSSQVLTNVTAGGTLSGQLTATFNYVVGTPNRITVTIG